MIPKRDKNTDIASDIAQGKNFQKRLRQAAEEASGRFVSGESLNKAAADIANRENFNQLQIQRLVEEANTLAFNKKYSEVKKQDDRRISFELAELSVILDLMGSAAPAVVDNPNWVKGKPGDGEMVKSASYQSYTLNSTTDASRDRLRLKQAAEKEDVLRKQAKTLNAEIESGIFKVAQSLLRSEQIHKNSNNIFNTMLSEVSLDDSLIEGISKKASEIADRMKETGRVHSGFSMNLVVSPEEKTASSLFGEYSLLKRASESLTVEPPKVAPIQDIGDYQKLISLAKEIQKKQNSALSAEKELHGGAN